MNMIMKSHLDFCELCFDHDHFDVSWICASDDHRHIPKMVHLELEHDPSRFHSSRIVLNVSMMVDRSVNLTQTHVEMIDMVAQ